MIYLIIDGICLDCWLIIFTCASSFQLGYISDLIYYYNYNLTTSRICSHGRGDGINNASYSTCMQDTLLLRNTKARVVYEYTICLYAKYLCSRVHSAQRPLGQARATIWYIVYKQSARVIVDWHSPIAHQFMNLIIYTLIAGYG